MASHYPHHHHHNHHQPPPPPPPPSTHCCCTTPPPPPQQDHHLLLLQAITSLLYQPQHHPITTIPPTHHHHYPKSHTFLSQTHHQHQHQTHSASISSLLHRIESLESSLLTHHHHSLSSSSLSLRHAAARVIQTHFRSFLARRSRTLRHLKHLALIKSTFNSLKSSLSQNTINHLDFPSLSLKAVNLLLQLDSIDVNPSWGCDPMIVDGKKSITRDLVQFLDSIEGVAVKKKRMHCVKSAKCGRFAQRANKSSDSDDDEKRKLLQNLRGRVERINRLCTVSENEEGDFDHEGVQNVDYGIYDNDDGDRVSNVVISGRNEVFPKKNVVFVQKQGVQPKVKKSVKFAENGKICEVYSISGGSPYEQDLSGDVVCLDGSSCSDDQGEVSEHVGCAVEDDVDPSQDDDEALVGNVGESPHSSDDGGGNNTRASKNDSRNIVKGQIQTQQGKILFSAPMPLKMENKTELMKSKGVRILT